MAAPQGLLQFGLLTPNDVMYGNVSLSHGVTPSTAVLYVVPKPPNYPRVAPLIISYGGQRIVMPDCLLDRVEYTQDQSGHTIMVCHILDRRWKWRFGQVRGAYNVREQDGSIRASTFRTPRQLAELCFEAMGEKRYAVRQLPNDAYPEVDWDGNPSEYLAQLCDQLGCRVSLNAVTNTPEIVRIGVGQQLPSGLDVLVDSLEIDAPELPDKLIFHGSPNLYDFWFEMEPVGEDTDGTIKPINELSYKPKGGWSRSLPPNLPNVHPNHRDRAAKCLYKWWRPKMPVTVYTEKVETLDRLLPLETERAQTVLVNAEKKEDTSGLTFDQKRKLKKAPKLPPVRKRAPAMVVGDFVDFQEADKPGEVIAETPIGKKQIWEQGFQIDAARGILMLSRPAVLLQGLPKEEAIPASVLTGDTVVKRGASIPKCNIKTDLCDRTAMPARIWLYTATGIRSLDTRAWAKKEYTLVPKGPKLGTQPFYITRADIGLRRWQEFDIDEGFTERSNEDELERQAKYYLEQTLRMFQWSAPGQRVYAGFKAISVDGALQQVTWSLDQQGFARTTIARNTDSPGRGMTFAERRFIERQKHLAKHGLIGGRSGAHKPPSERAA